MKLWTLVIVSWGAMMKCLFYFNLQTRPFKWHWLGNLPLLLLMIMYQIPKRKQWHPLPTQL